VRLVVGLGNPGPRYRGTRHNLGFEVVERLGRAWGAVFRRRFEGQGAAVTGPGGPVTLLMPQTYMNDSGRAVAAARRRMGLAPEEILVVHDDLDLPVGSVRVRPRGSSGGHNGLRSIIAALGSEAFGRVRLGIGHPGPGEDVVAYVLERFAPAERDAVEAAVARAVDAVVRVLRDGYEAAMNEVNAKAPADRSNAADGG
jgi:PTH1 family peptidyl-tRNA hydrolase